MKPTSLAYYLLSAVALLTFDVSFAQSSIFQAFKADKDLRITVQCHWDTLSNIRDDTEIPGAAVYGDQEWELEIRLRGRSRRMSCDTTLLPFRMQFRRKELRNAGYDEFRNHKVVTPCLDNKSGVESLQEELLLYQLFRIITDSSFMTTEGLLTRTWPDDRFEADEIPILIIEPNEELAARLNGVEVETVNFPADSIDPWSYNVTALFQFMIGNFDWNYRFNHNIKVIRTDGNAIIVPYDFDYAAICDVPYRRVPSDMNMTNKYDRVYLGEHFIDQLPATIAHFQALKSAIYDHVDSFETLKNSRRKWIMKYFDTFYEYISDPESTFEYRMRLPYGGL